MKSGLVALDPSSEAGPSFQSFCDILKTFKNHGLLTRTSVAGVVYPSLYAVPYRAYRGLRGTYIKAANERLQAACAGALGFDTVRVLSTESSDKEEHVNLLTRCAHRLGHEFLIFASAERAEISQMALGSYSETASLVARIPVFVIKPSFSPETLSKKPHFVLAVDAASPPSSRAVRWIADFAKPANATIDLVYVRPRKRFLIDSLQKRKSPQETKQALAPLQNAFAKQTLKTRVVVLEENHSIAEAIAEHSEKSQAWATITTEAIRTKPRKLLLGSTARRILANTSRPFLSLRMV